MGPRVDVLRIAGRLQHDKKGLGEDRRVHSTSLQRPPPPHLLARAPLSHPHPHSLAGDGVACFTAASLDGVQGVAFRTIVCGGPPSYVLCPAEFAQQGRTQRDQSSRPPTTPPARKSCEYLTHYISLLCAHEWCHTAPFLGLQRRAAALESVTRGVVQVDAGTAVPPTMQGDLDLYTDEALDMRLRLRLSPTLMNAVQQVP